MINSQRLAHWLAMFTFAWLLVYVPLESYVTWSIAGFGGFLYSSYIMNVVGMGLMLWGAVTTRSGAPTGAAVLAVGWSWTAATFWRATSDRFWWVSLGNELYAGPAELWLAPALTAVAVAALVASMVLVFRQTRGGL